MSQSSIKSTHFLYLGQCVSWLEAFPHDMRSSSGESIPKAQEKPAPKWLFSLPLRACTSSSFQFAKISHLTWHETREIKAES